MNLVLLMGRLTKDPDVRQTGAAGAMTVARYTIAVDRRFKKDGQQNSDFINLVSFGKTAEFVANYVKKGTKIVVQGEIQNNNYEKDGQKVYSDQIIANSVEFAESKNANRPTEPDRDRENDKSIPSVASSLEAMPDFMAIPDSDEIDVPF